MSTETLKAWYGALASEIENNLTLFGWALFKEYLQLAGFSGPDDKILEPSSRFKNILVAMDLFSRFYDKSPATPMQMYQTLGEKLGGNQELYEKIMSDAQSAKSVEFEIMISWCSDQAAMVRLGIGPYVQFGADAPKSTCDLIAGQLQVEPSYYSEMTF